MRRFFKPYDSYSGSILEATVIVVALVLGVVGCASFEHLTQVSNSFPEAKECGKCHIDIYEEWSGSDHTHAYVNPHFRAATGDYAFDDCLNCHAPEPRFTAETPGLRSSSREEGVTCVACHLTGGELCGPLEPTGKVQPHPVGVKPEVYRSAGFCGRCHEGTLAQWESVTEEKQTCQQCHMPEVVRKMTQSSGGFSNIIVGMEHEESQRHHTFAIPTAESIDEIILVKATGIGNDIEVTVRNGLPHSLPTGDYGFRILVLDLWAKDGQGTEHSLTHAELAPEMKTHIPAFGTWSCFVTPPAESTSLRLRLQRRSYDDQPTTDLVDRIIELEPHDAAQ